MTSTIILQQRKAEAIEAAFGPLEEISPTERLIEAKSEPIREPEYALPILVAELARALAEERERVARLERALDHTVTHVLPGEISGLELRIEKLEKAAKPTAGTKKEPTNPVVGAPKR